MNRAQMQYVALEQDWNRLRDFEREWRIFAERVGKVALVILVVAVVSTLIGCAPASTPADWGTPDLHLADGTPCWWMDFTHRLHCERVHP